MFFRSFPSFPDFACHLKPWRATGELSVRRPAHGIINVSKWNIFCDLAEGFTEFLLQGAKAEKEFVCGVAGTQCAPRHGQALPDHARPFATGAERRPKDRDAPQDVP